MESRLGKGNIEVYRPGIDERSHDPDIRAAYERVAPTIYALTAAIDAKDSYTFIHSMNVSKYAVILAEALGMNSNDIEIIRRCRSFTRHRKNQHPGTHPAENLKAY